MTEERFIELVGVAADINIDDNDLYNKVKLNAFAVMEHINRGGGNITLENVTEYEIKTIALGVNDLLNVNDPKYSQGFYSMAQQIQLGGR